MRDNQHEHAEEVAYSHFQSAWKAHKNGDQESALSHIDAAIKLASNFATKSVYLTTKGGFLKRMGLYESAVMPCEEAISIVPENYHAWNQLGLAFLKMERYENAAKCFNEIVQLRPDHCIYTLLARAQLEYDPRAALISAEKALELEPSWEEAQGICELAKHRIDKLNQAR